MGTNCNGIMKKVDSLLNNISLFSPGIFFLQETRVNKKGTLKIPNYYIFETIRENKDGGSLITGVHENLSPVLIFEDNQLEILVVQVIISQYACRFINAYGPQEGSWSE